MNVSYLKNKCNKFFVFYCKRYFILFYFFSQQTELTSEGSVTEEIPATNPAEKKSNSAGKDLKKKKVASKNHDLIFQRLLCDDLQKDYATLHIGCLSGHLYSNMYACMHSSLL